MMDLTNKRILFLSAKAFGIPEGIVDTLVKFGAQVDYFDERPANNFLTKALIRINRNLIGGYINKYHKRIIQRTSAIKYDFIFFIKGESFSERNIKTLFRLHPEAKTLIYHWDSIANNHNALALLKYFDAVFSFDKGDCEINKNIRFLPLFYFDEYIDVANANLETEYDLMFVGTTHSDRYRIISSIIKQFQKYGGRCFSYFFFQGKIMFYRYRLLNPDLKNLNIRDVHFTPMNKSDLLELYKISDTIIDIHHPKQSGLTLRCFEALGAKKKLITTNANIADYDFYDSNNILIIDRNNPNIPDSFIKNKYKEVDRNIYEKYSISSWVNNIISNTIKS